MKYVSTRSSERKVDAAQAIVAGLSHEGGLYVPESFPQFSENTIGAMAGLTYAQRAKQVMGAYLTDYTDEEIKEATFGFVKYYVQSRHYDDLVAENEKLKKDLEIETDWHTRDTISD